MTDRLSGADPPNLAAALRAELGRHPMGLMIGGALVFDHHTHLRHDMATALGRPVPPTEADRMRAVLTWIIAVLSNQVAQAPVAGLDARVALTLTGPGGARSKSRKIQRICPGPPRARLTAGLLPSVTGRGHRPRIPAPHSGSVSLADVNPVRTPAA